MLFHSCMLAVDPIGCIHRDKGVILCDYGNLRVAEASSFQNITSNYQIY